MHDATPDTREELLAEPVSDEEVRELLDRLGYMEFDASPQATVGAIVEATGTDPVVIARLLGDIRHEAFEERFERTFGEHREVLEDHEERIERLEGKNEPAEPQEIPFLEFNVSKMGFEHKGPVTETQSVTRVMFVIVVALLLTIILVSIVANPPSMHSYPTSPVNPMTGVPRGATERIIRH